MHRALPLLRRRLALAWLLLALVLAPTLGRMHQVLHLPGGAAPQAHAHGAARQAFLQAFFATHADPP